MSGDTTQPLQWRTFIDILDRLGTEGDERGHTYVKADGTEKFVGYATLERDVKARGRQLLGTGLRKGDRLALIIPDADEFVLTFLGAVSAGIVPVPLYPPLALGKLDAYIDTTTRILNAAQADLLVTTKQVEKVLWTVMPRVPSLRDILTIDAVAALPEAASPPPKISPYDTLFLQFTSGSTAEPKGVVVTHESMVANVKAVIFDGLEAKTEKDIGVSWLPLYHDMGLIGFVLAPLLVRIAIVFIPTMEFVRRPTLWMDVVSRHRGTLTFAPNFAFARVTKRAGDKDLARWDLSCLRVVGCGAEPIHAGTMQAFVDKFSRAGMKPEAMLPCYGMAEATLAMSFVGHEDRIKVDVIDADRCHENQRAVPAKNGAATLALVSCGKAFPGHEIGIFDEEGRRLPERRIGEIRFRGPSVTAGYYENLEATRKAFLPDGWLCTGDLGYLAGGEVYISGRRKDILIVHGRNYYPQGIEWQVEEVEGIRKGNVVAFSVPGEGSEEVVVVAETTEADPAKRLALGQRVKSHLNGTLSLVPADVVLLGVGQLPKTTSGKLQRRKTREQYLKETLGTEGVRTLGSTGERLSIARHLVMSLASRVSHRASRIWPWWPISMIANRKRAE
jgi:fatty-acyl-CoA synthase